MQGREGRQLTKGFAGKTAVGRHINTENNAREVHVHPCVMSDFENTTGLTQVCQKTVEGDA